MMNDYKDFNRVLRSALVGEERSKVKVLDMLEPLIRSSIKSYCPVFSEFEDLYSDGRAVVLSCIEDFDNKRSFLKYVKSSLKYYYLNTYKYLLNVNSDVHEVATDDEEDSLNIFNSIDAGVDIEGDFLERERLGILKKAIDSLTPRQETVIRLFFYERLGLSDIANFLGISKWTVVNLKRNAIENMRDYISCYYK
ncbi:MAG: sigma-70 family RNA polymerase sigma factor [Peptoniphilus sp.]|uniref:sigma-70 family RNA polymerase sigma factor n=1 Tax=Peptoniphilus sp. TaxID=1971214 RepID=UPI0025FB8B37|nr:sigma-70 family RNA polymerase sigma factor [Peptoniphilus sp.]MCI5642791.1 sigma-70 family RNA polymerase sigma factor [Peptoniphilus sp.]